MQLAFPHARRARTVGRSRSRWIPARVSGDVARRDDAASHSDALSQPCVDGRRGIDSRQPARRCRPADGLRQDDAVAADGCGQRGHPDDRRVRRADAARHSLRQGDRLRNERHLDERAVALGPDHADGVPRGGGRHAPFARPLHDDGHRVDDGVHGRSARRRPAGERRGARRRRATQSARTRSRPADRRARAERHGAVADTHSRSVRERDPRERRHRRIHERRRAPDSDRAPRRHRSRTRRLGPARTRRALPRRHHAVGALPDGRLLRSRRAAGGHRANSRSTDCCTTAR